jgi:hypothetical protein
MNTAANSFEAPVLTLDEISEAEQSGTSGMTARQLITQILKSVDDLDLPMYIHIDGLTDGERYPIQRLEVFDSDPEDSDGDVVYPTLLG